MDILVVIDAVPAGFVISRLTRFGKVGDIPDEGDWMSVFSEAGFGEFVDFVVEEEVFLPLFVEDPPLMRVSGSFIGSSRDNSRFELIRDIEDGECILIVRVTDFATDEFGVGSTVNETLGIMDVAVLPCAAWAGRIGDVRHVDENNTSSAGGISWRGTNREDEVGFVVGDNVVGCAVGEFVKETGEIQIGRESLRRGWVQTNELFFLLVSACLLSSRTKSSSPKSQVPRMLAGWL